MSVLIWIQTVCLSDNMFLTELFEKKVYFEISQQTTKSLTITRNAKS